MNRNLPERIVAGAVFLFALVLYGLTVAPTASFWDTGEFITIANRLEVSHPPGAPFYMLVGRLFSMLVPASHVGLAVNLVSVIASAFTILLTHLIIVRLIREWQAPAETRTLEDRITALSGGVIGAVTFAATDSFWFNAVEAEVYGLSMCFTATVVWLIMKWSEQARAEEALLAGGHRPFGLRANRYIVLIAYLFGLAIGVHLLNLLAIFFIALIFFFTEIEESSWGTRERWRGILLTGCISVVIFLAIYPGIVQYLPVLVGAIASPVLFVLALIGVLTFGVWFTNTRRMERANLAMLSLTVVLIGYSTYALIFIRSAADPPVDENDPETTEAIVSYLKREQYGSTPLLKGPNFNQVTGTVDRYGESWLPRRHSPDPDHIRAYRLYESDWDFFWNYQVGHMYVRYFLWQFVGRASDVQDAPPATGFRFIDDPAGANDYLRQTPSEEASRNVYYALPLLLGLIGAGFHFSRDWRRALSVLILFLATGLGIIVYLNQTPMQPRERDYAYVASFFAFSLWTGFGATGILQLLQESLRGSLQKTIRYGALAGLGILIFLAVPGWMVRENYFDHDRSGNVVAPDYAYNMLNSLDNHAIVFTNGDNDTFPLWYLQEVEGMRRDVRVVNLSLLNTPWYIKQLKHQWSRESAPLPISMPDGDIELIGATRWRPNDLEIPVETGRFAETSDIFLSQADTSRIMNPMRWRLEGRPYDDESNILYAADQATLNLLVENARQGWERPIYFAVTVSQDGQLGLQNFFQLEGQAFQIVPIRHEEYLGRIDPSVTPQGLLDFKFRNLDNPDVYYDETTRRMVDNYRNIFAHTARSLAKTGYREQAVTLLDTLMTQVPFETIAGDERSYFLLAQAWQEAGRNDRAVDLVAGAEPLLLHAIGHARTSREIQRAAQYVQLLRATYLYAGAFERASEFSGHIADLLGDPTYRQSPEELQQMVQDTLESSADSLGP